MINPEIGFTSDVIRDPKRFVGRSQLIRNCIRAINTSVALVGVYGKRGLGKSSLLRQIQQMALGDYTLAKNAGLSNEIPKSPKRYVTVYYSCDAIIENSSDLLKRLCNDQDTEDGLLRLVPDDGKEIVEFTRTSENSLATDLKVLQWGKKGISTNKYARIVDGDIVQTFRNFINSVIEHQAKKLLHRDGLLILLDEFDVIKNKTGLGSLIKSLSSENLKFAICGIGHDFGDLIEDHASIERLLEQGAIHVQQMSESESIGIIDRAEILFNGTIKFDTDVKQEIVRISQGYPYFAQMLGRSCVEIGNKNNCKSIDKEIFDEVMENVKNGSAFPILESTYQRVIGATPGRQILLHLLAEQQEERTMLNEDVGRVFLKKIRNDATDLKVEYIDQLIPRLVEEKNGVLERLPETPGVYEFRNPVFRLYVQLRNI